MEIIGLIIFLIVFVCVFRILWPILSKFIDSDYVPSVPVMTFEQMCETSSVITLTWCVTEGHATNDKGYRILTREAWPELIAKASKYGLYPTTNNGNMMTLVKYNS